MESHKKRDILAYSIIILGFVVVIAFGFFEINWSLPFSSLLSEKEYQGKGYIVPKFNVKLVNGSEFNTEDNLGMPLILNFWATWCAPCRIEMPLFEELQSNYGSRITIVGINFDESEKQVMAYKKDLGITFYLALDPGGEIQQMFRINGYPTTIFIDKDGIVRAEHIGLISDGQLTKNLELIGISGE